MRDTKSIVLPLLAAAFRCAGLTSASPTQGEWRQWEVGLRDGTRLQGKPLGAPDNGHLSLSVGAAVGKRRSCARTTVGRNASRGMADSSAIYFENSTSLDLPTDRRRG